MSDTPPAPAPMTENDALEHFRAIVRANPRRLKAALFADVVAAQQQAAAHMPEGSTVFEYAEQTPQHTQQPGKLWMELFSTAVHAVQRPHYTASLQRYAEAHGAFHTTNYDERSRAAQGVWSWWLDDAPALYRGVLESHDATRAVLERLGLLAEFGSDLSQDAPEQPQQSAEANTATEPYDATVRATLAERQFAVVKDLADRLEQQLLGSMAELDATRAERDALRAELDATRAERDALRADLERATAPTPDVPEADQ